MIGDGITSQKPTDSADATAAAVFRTSLPRSYILGLAHPLNAMKVSVRSASGENDDVRTRHEAQQSH